MENEKKKKFNLFSRAYADGKGVDKNEKPPIDNPTLKNFFKTSWRKLNMLFGVNMLLIFGNFPLLFGLFGLTGYLSEHTTTSSYQLYSSMSGVLRFEEGSPVTGALFGIFSHQQSTTVMTTATLVLFSLCALVIFTFGLVNVGTTYILRNMLRGEGVFLWSDFWYAIKRNLRQGIIFGIIDVALMVLLAFDIIFYRFNMASGAYVQVMFYAGCAMAVLYFFMRLYIYLMMITFDLSIYKLIKNAIYFSVLGIKRNIMALIGVLLMIGADYLLFNVAMPIGIVMPFTVLFAWGSFMGVYAAYPKIKEIMIDPYYDEKKGKPDEDNAETEPEDNDEDTEIITDRG